MARKYQKGLSVLHFIMIVLIVGGGSIWLMSYNKNQKEIEQKAVAAKKAAEAEQATIKSLDGIHKLVKRWDDANTLADSTARVALNNPISDMQSIRREMADLEMPECISKHKDLIIRSMDLTIDGYILFMQNIAPESDDPQTSISKAFLLRSEFISRLLNCKANYKTAS